MHIVRWIVSATVFIALLFLSLQNSEPAELKFFNLASLRAPLVVVVFVAFAMGVALGLLAGTLRSARLKRQVNKLRRDQKTLHDPSLVTSGAAAPGTTPDSAQVQAAMKDRTMFASGPRRSPAMALNL